MQIEKLYKPTKRQNKTRQVNTRYYTGKDEVKVLNSYFFRDPGS